MLFYKVCKSSKVSFKPFINFFVRKNELQNLWQALTVTLRGDKRKCCERILD